MLLGMVAVVRLHGGHIDHRTPVAVAHDCISGRDACHMDMAYDHMASCLTVAVVTTDIADVPLVHVLSPVVHVVLPHQGYAQTWLESYLGIVVGS